MISQLSHLATRSFHAHRPRDGQPSLERLTTFICFLAALLASTVIGSAPAHADEPKPKEAFTINDERITESSGLALSRQHEGIFYTLNDGEGEPEIFALDENGEVVATIVAGQAPAVDTEAIATGPLGIYIGDIGDNEKSHDVVTVFYIEEPAELTDTRLGWNRFRFEYEDGPHDAEALLVEPSTGQIYVVTKDPEGGAIYAAPEEPLTGGDNLNTLTRVADAPPMITDGTFLPDGSAAVIRSYDRAYVIDPTTGEVSRTIGLPRQKQGESLAVSADGKLLYAGSEGSGSVVYAVSTNAPPPPTPKPSKKPSPPAETSEPESGAEAGKDSGVSGWFSGIPWWIPALVIGGALLAGLLAFPRARKRSQSQDPGGRDRVPARVGGPAGAAEGGLDPDAEVSDRYGYASADPHDAPWMTDEADQDGWSDQPPPWQDDGPPWQGGDAPPGWQGAEPPHGWQDGDRPWQPEPADRGWQGDENAAPWPPPPTAQEDFDGPTYPDQRPAYAESPPLYADQPTAPVDKIEGFDGPPPQYEGGGAPPYDSPPDMFDYPDAQEAGMDGPAPHQRAEYPAPPPAWEDGGWEQPTQPAGWDQGPAGPPGWEPAPEPGLPWRQPGGAPGWDEPPPWDQPGARPGPQGAGADYPPGGGPGGAAPPNQGPAWADQPGAAQPTDAPPPWAADPSRDGPGGPSAWRPEPHGRPMPRRLFRDDDPAD